MGEIVQFVRLGKRSAETPVLQAPFDSIASPAARSKEALVNILRHMKLQHDRLDQVIEAVRDEPTRLRFRHTLRVLQQQIELVTVAAKLI